MPRELYPYEPDRKVIDAFLAGKNGSDPGSSLVGSKEALVSYEARHLWYDSADALTTVVDGPITKHIANYVLEQVGASERITVEVNETEEQWGGSRPMMHHRVRYFFGGVPADEAPFVLVGPMTLMAWRAANGFKLNRASERRK